MLQHGSFRFLLLCVIVLHSLLLQCCCYSCGLVGSSEKLCWVRNYILRKLIFLITSSGHLSVISLRQSDFGVLTEARHLRKEGLAIVRFEGGLPCFHIRIPVDHELMTFLLQNPQQLELSRSSDKVAWFSS